MTYRKVERAMTRSGRGSFLGPDTSRRAHWWDLKLSCGHHAERAVRRRDGEVLPAPKRVLCRACASETAWNTITEEAWKRI